MKKQIFTVFVLLALICALLSCQRETPADISTVSEIKGDPNVFYLENGLYDIGEYMSDEKYEYFTGEPVYEFVPRDDYGHLLQFSGGLKHYHTKEDPMIYGFDMSYSKSGLCTTDGKVVVEPVYEYINSFTSADGFKYFNLSYENDVEIDEDGNIMNFDDVFIATRQVIIPHDGSWSIELSNGSYISGVGDGIITVCERTEDKEEYKLYDYDGNYLLSIDGYDYVDVYSCGYAAARIYPEYSHDAKDTRENGLCVYLDKTGSVALDGGYTDGTNFNKYGIASVQIDGGKYALINTKGEFLTQPIYDSLYRTGEEEFQGYLSETNERHLFGGNGELIGNVNTAGTSYVSFVKISDSEMAYNYYDSKNNREMWYRLSDNSLIVCKENGKMPNDYTYGNNLFIYKDSKDGNIHSGEGPAILFDFDGNTVAKLDRYRYASWIDNEAKLMGYVRNNPDAKPMTDEEEKLYGMQNKDEFAILNTVTGEEICVFKNCYYAALLGSKKNLVAVQIHTMEDGGKAEYYLYDISQKQILPGFEKICEYKVSSADGREYLTVVKQDSVTLYDKDFNIILKKYLDENI